jgi:hypothetical protein
VANEDAALAAIDGADTGRTGPSTTNSGSPLYIVDGAPEDLASQAGLDVDTYSLARMVSSEEGSGNAATLLCLAEAARNKAQQRGQSVSQLLTASKRSDADGNYSAQAAGKWASTRRDPNGRHVAAAQAALQQGTDLAAGAVDYFDPSSQDGGTQGGVALRKTSEDYIAQNAAQGLYWVGPIADIDAYHLMLFAPGSGTADDALNIVAQGRVGGDTMGPGGTSNASTIGIALALVGVGVGVYLLLA